MTDWLERTFENTGDASLRQAIESGRLRSVAGVHGATFAASIERTRGRVEFTFTRAFVGSYDSVFGTPQVGAYVGIAAALHDCGTHPRVRFVQVCREIGRGADGMIASVRPRDRFRAERSGYTVSGDEQAAPSRGWRVDQSLAHDSVFWTDAGRKDGRDGSSEQPARLLDAPASLPDPETGEPASNVGKEFRSCIVSVDRVLACVAWGYYIDERGVVAMLPAVPVAASGAGAEVFDAIERWDRTPGHRASGIVRPV